MSNSKHLFAFCLVIGMLLSFSACTGDSEKGEVQLVTEKIRSASSNYTTSEAFCGSVTSRTPLSIPALIQYTSTAEVFCKGFASETLLELYISEGALVEKGEPIAKFTVTASEAERNSLENAVSIAKLEYNNGLAAKKKAVTAAKEVLAACEPDSTEAKIAELKVSKAQSDYNYYASSNKGAITRAQEALDDFNEQASEAFIYAPCAGTVTLLSHLDENSYITEDTRICTIVGYDTLYLAADVEARHGFRYNSEARIELPTDVMLTGRIFSAPDVMGNSTGPAYIRLDNGAGIADLNYGKSRILVSAARAHLENVLLIPSDAVCQEEAKKYVYLMEDNVIKKRYIQVGISGVCDETGAEVTQVISGVEENAVIVIYK